MPCSVAGLALPQGKAAARHHVQMHFTRQEYARLRAQHQRIDIAQQNYDRLRLAYLKLARAQPEHEVALAMIGADVDRAHAVLQALVGLPAFPTALEPSRVLRRQAAADNCEEHRKAANG